MAWRAGGSRCSPRCVRAPARQARTRADPHASPLSLRDLGPARDSGCTGGTPGTLSSAPKARSHWLSRPVGVTGRDRPEPALPAGPGERRKRSV